MTSKDAIGVLVTGVGGGGVGEQLLKSLRASTLPLRIVGADVTALSKGSIGLERFITLPPANAPNYLDALLMGCEDNRVDVLFPGSEPELKIMVRHRAEIEATGVVLSANSAEVIDICLDKFKTATFLQAHGFRFPKSYQIRSLKDCDEINTFPVILKPSVGGGGSVNTFIVQDRQELLFFCAQMLAQYEEFLGQEYVGTPDDEYTVGVLSDLNGETINSIAVHRMIRSGLGCRINMPNRSGRTELGDRLVVSSGISQGHIGKYAQVTSECEAIARALRSKGPLNIQCRFVNGRVCVFEINPRYSGTTYFRTMVGFNEPEIMIRLSHLHQAVERDFHFESGHILRGLDEVFIKDENGTGPC
jgi:carbamoyl-phosphate synthase large subunit